MLKEAKFLIGKRIQEHSQSLDVDGSAFVDVAIATGEHLLVYPEHGSQSTFIDVKSRQVGKEIITNEEGHEDKVINDLLHVKGKRHLAVLQLLKFQFEVFSHNAEMHQVEILVLQLLDLDLDWRPNVTSSRSKQK